MNTKKLIQYFLVFSLIVGIVLLFFTIYFGMILYSEISYKQSLQKNLAILKSLENVGVVCEHKSDIQTFTISETKLIYFENPSNLISVKIKIKPRNELQEIGSFGYIPLFLFSFYLAEDTNPIGIKVKNDDTINDAICNVVNGKNYLINITSLKNELICDDGFKLTKNYGFGCLAWKENTVIVGELGEKLSCEYEIKEVESCENPILIESYEEIRKYTTSCKNFCFHIPSSTYCTGTRNAINKYLVNSIYKWLKENVEVFEVYKGTNYGFRYIKEQEKTINYDSQFSSLLGDFSFTFNQALYGSFITQLRLLESHYRMIYGDRKAMRKILLISSNVNVFNTSFCENFRGQNITVVLLKFADDAKIPKKLNVGCNEVEIYDLKNLYEFFNLFYDEKYFRTVTSKNLLVQWNPKNPEFFTPTLKEEKEILIMYNEQYKDLPLTISVNGAVDVELNITRNVCRAIAKN